MSELVSSRNLRKKVMRKHDMLHFPKSKALSRNCFAGNLTGTQTLAERSGMTSLDIEKRQFKKNNCWKVVHGVQSLQYVKQLNVGCGVEQLHSYTNVPGQSPE